ncbi:MAG: Flp pilus assembly complex ATPase component TadA [Proteobacteria bacterium]|nr:Flp pilus assembly complex ATPase component TadA [Pseudomonadota bacterium]MBU1739840.1 Flp pilus assembly complex ATPase component TadA [Pseudomonadota bacterium]
MAQIKTKKRFGDILVDGGLLTATQLHQALSYASDREIKLGMALQELGFVNDVAVARTLATQLRMPFVDLEKIVIDPEIVTAIPELMARKFKVVAIGRKPGEILVAFADPLNIFATDELTKHLKEKLVPCVAVESRVVSAIDRLYANTDAPIISMEGSAEESEAVTMVNDMLLQAVREEASDIHLEPNEKSLRVRFRVDGMMRVVKEFPSELHPSIVSRIKVISQMDIGERRKPQDGRFEIPVSGRDFDVRVSTLPINYGEKIVMRLLDKSKVKIDMRDLGLEAEQQKLFEKHLYNPHEIILVTGPTGSGKTTTLYSALNLINSVDKNIVTVEDPVEYELAGVNQVQVNPRADLTFSSALRSILRQDPDVVMIGEIRDVETAEISIQAALTGHLVLSTLHTNDACGAVTRLIDMGIPPFLISSALGAVIAQRLVRVLCKKCREPFNPPQTLQEELGIDYDPELTFYRAKGCARCDHTGFKGRVAIYEVLSLSSALEDLIMERASTHELYRLAVSEGMVTLRRSGILKVISGQTSLEEVLRVAMEVRD